jgi:hypothetical protein
MKLNWLSVYKIRILIVTIFNVLHNFLKLSGQSCESVPFPTHCWVSKAHKSIRNVLISLLETIDSIPMSTSDRNGKDQPGPKNFHESLILLQKLSKD